MPHQAGRLPDPSPQAQSHGDSPDAWLVVADDLTGAAECAVAFARRGHGALVAWEDAPEGTPGGSAATPLPDSPLPDSPLPDSPGPSSPVLALDADSRRLPAAQASARHEQIFARHARPGLGLLKKIDSTLRGQPLAELAGTLALLRGRGMPRLAVLAPAFPANGRTLRAGRVHLQGAPLEQSALWAREHSYPSACLPELLAAAGLKAAHLPLPALRAGEEALRAALRHALAQGLEAVVCDAEVTEDLEALARAGLPLSAQLLWVGAGGLAHALAAAGPRGTA
ncbi:four-carbon acid sugar kinase family protein, partial [Roseomonas sp. GC11]|uniref:four-carbon acid sugar kinase family protein n=1 Tax=Roseomonas sp. GC11 TaxID=2950546 RepID=UPI00210AD3B7